MRDRIGRAGLIMTAIAAFAGIISFIHVFVPVGSMEQGDLRLGNYRVMADFPCRSKRHKQGVGTTETGEEISQTTLVCSQGGITYSLSATEHSEQLLKSLPVDVWVNRTLDSVRSQSHYTLKSSTRLSYQNFPAIRMYALDSKVPPMDLARLLILTDVGIIAIGGSWPSGSPEPSSATKFTSSLTITSVKK